MEIYLIRHTKPLLTPGLIYGHLEVELEAGFETEIDNIKSQLPIHLDAVYSSPATRCTLLAKEINPKYQIDERLRELHFGDWEGKTWDTVDQDNLKLWMEDFVHVRVPGGESMLDLKGRVEDFFRILNQQPEERIAVVTHGGVIRLLLTLLADKPLHQCFEMKVDYASVFKIDRLSTDRIYSSKANTV
ncbi:alpha-ribazole phosphatase [Dyadobacter sp. CY343]|uniref:alpha-ribazole phosphatase n=1 Tax=Dyadobacter sp. CY343 TaxID=2907299 RepID=UPI001F392BE1|nr:alpha-ribazole phosphatase [Dyadobacter sp. CY343]MCE7059170.1 alpha-ribazole phosphatase [Dyadobacter sp. CY343]